MSNGLTEMRHPQKGLEALQGFLQGLLPDTGKLDWTLLLVILGLVSIGFVMVSSASISFAEHNYGDGWYFVKRQIAYLSMATVLALVVLMTPVQFWYRHGLMLLFITVVLLSLVLIPGIGRKVNGSQRWIPLGPINLQVSEMAKLSLVVFMAGLLERHQVNLRANWKAVGKPLGIAGLLILLIILEPDFGSVVVLSGTVLVMLFIAGVQLWQFILMASLGGAGLGCLALFSPYRMQRLITFLDPWADQYNTGYQLTQSLIAFGRGETFGVGLGKSVQKLFYLPEAHTDFVFAIFAEEFGFIGVLVVICLFLLLVTRILKFARLAFKREYWFEGYTCIGVAVIFAGQAFINIGVTSGMLPTKGLTLPFISFGGSSLLVCSAMAALVLRIGIELQGAARLTRKGNGKV